MECRRRGLYNMVMVVRKEKYIRVVYATRDEMRRDINGDFKG